MERSTPRSPRSRGRSARKKDRQRIKDGGRRTTRRRNDEKANDEKKVREDVIVVSADEVGIEHEAGILGGPGAKVRQDQDQGRPGNGSPRVHRVLHESDGRVDLMRLDRCNTDNVLKA